MEHLEGSGLTPNIRLGWRGLPGTNTLTFYKNPYFMAVKSFIVQAPEHTFLEFSNNTEGTTEKVYKFHAPVSMDKLKLTGLNLGRVFNCRCGRASM